MSLGSFLKKIKKKVSIKNVIKGAAVLGGALPIVGGVLQSAAQNATAAKEQATQAQAQAREDLAASAMTGTVPVNPNAPPTREAFPMKYLLIGGGVLAAIFLLKRR